jgi:hypothetical protein
VYTYFERLDEFVCSLDGVALRPGDLDLCMRPWVSLGGKEICILLNSLKKQYIEMWNRCERCAYGRDENPQHDHTSLNLFAEKLVMGFGLEKFASVTSAQVSDLECLLVSHFRQCKIVMLFVHVFQDLDTHTQQYLCDEFFVHNATQGQTCERVLQELSNRCMDIHSQHRHSDTSQLPDTDNTCTVTKKFGSNFPPEVRAFLVGLRMECKVAARDDEQARAMARDVENVTVSRVTCEVRGQGKDTELHLTKACCQHIKDNYLDVKKYSADPSKKALGEGAVCLLTALVVIAREAQAKATAKAQYHTHELGSDVPHTEANGRSENVGDMDDKGAGAKRSQMSCQDAAVQAEKKQRT